MSTLTMVHRLSVTGEQTNPFGGIDATYQLDVWEGDTDSHLFVRVLKDGEPHASASFRDCETQHHDSERWLNDRVGFPNQFAGILLHRAWELSDGGAR